MRQPIEILNICTGNICRSPLSEQLLADRLRPFENLKVVSAGTGALVGAPMDPSALRIAEKLGLTGAGHHRAQQVTSELIMRSSLILAMDRGHQEWVLERFPKAKKKTFTLIGLADLVDCTRDEEIVEEYQSTNGLERDVLEPSLRAVRLSRDRIPITKGGDHQDIADPYMQPAEVFAKMERKLVPATRTVGDFIARALVLDLAHS